MDVVSTGKLSYVSITLRGWAPYHQLLPPVGGVEVLALKDQIGAVVFCGLQGLQSADPAVCHSQSVKRCGSLSASKPWLSHQVSYPCPPLITPSLKKQKTGLLSTTNGFLHA
jgi:hypothetical protein